MTTEIQAAPMLKTYYVRCEATFEVTIEANSKEEAIRLAPDLHAGDFDRILTDWTAELVSDWRTVPWHTHDCAQCVFLGQYLQDEERYDLYFCEQGGALPTVIARYGRDQEYTSGDARTQHPALLEAHAMAERRGLL